MAIQLNSFNEAQGMREGTESTEGKADRVQFSVGSNISQILEGTISSAKPSDPRPIQNGWSTNYWCLVHDCRKHQTALSMMAL